MFAIRKDLARKASVVSFALGLIMALSAMLLGSSAQAGCERTIRAEVVALDQPFFWNRLGAYQPQGMIYALKRDVIPISGNTLGPGNAQLRPDKRPRPLVLRMNEGDCLEITFTNLLANAAVDDEQPATRAASIHVNGMQLVNDITDDGLNLGTNANGLVEPGGTKVYTLFAEREGAHHFYSGGAMTGGEGDGGSLNAGLFGAINVEPRGSTWFRSQVTAADLVFATTGVTPHGQPIINYNAVYPDGATYLSGGNIPSGTPVLKILDDSNNIVHSDLTAIVVPRAGTYRPNPVYPNRDQPFREYTIIYHDEIGAVQAFPAFFEDDVLGFTLHGVRDGFAHNYGSAGAGAEIVANRLGVGPMWDCTECKYEEFFLTSWAVGDPAMVVDRAANTTEIDPNTGDPVPGTMATVALYPDDPSNVYHSYLNDHVKFRIIHGGSKEHHIHHLHAHQWLHSPDSDNSAYLDSQHIGPGTAFTQEICFNGSGNRNKTVGDSIFHCHFYPHFAQGMWSLWRTHDVFENGTRKLPDGEIVAGTPIPAIVPLPGIPLAPMPGANVTVVPADANGDGTPDSSKVQISGNGNPGFPFFIAGAAGHRPSHPPLDTIHNGGLPRHYVVSDPNNTAREVHTRLDFTKEILAMKAQEVPERGTRFERAAMDFHAQRNHASSVVDLSGNVTPGNYITNGRPPVRGAPFAEPCVDDDGNAVASAGTPRRYRAAVIQIDAIQNKSGWHFPQTRLISLWNDVNAFYNGTRAPEPFAIRANSGDCIEYLHTNLVPGVYELDDFQVRTPTDLIGQHIHLVKFDVTSADGSGNGWNYEDGTFSPDEVIERIHALNAFDSSGSSGLLSPLGNPRPDLTAKAHPFFKVLGAQTTVQRWYADEVLNLNGEDRTLRTVYTHDHFGPSTHQQAGLYAGLLIEPKGSRWRDPLTGNFMGSRSDGGPTSWRADILTGENGADSHREFFFEFIDFGLSYQKDSHPELPSGGGPVRPKAWDGIARQPGEGFDKPFQPDLAINPPGREEVGLPFLVERADECPGGEPLPCPESISAEDVGSFFVNYRNEPIPLRVRDPNTNTQADPNIFGLPAGDFSYAFRSDVTRVDPVFNLTPNLWPYPNATASRGARRGDPFTPLMRAYENDKIQVRVMVGATEESHNFDVTGVKWLYEPSWTNSGYRGSQAMGISEHFEMITPLTDPVGDDKNFADYLYRPSASVDGMWNGCWGLMRAYRTVQGNLKVLPNNDISTRSGIVNAADFNGPCPRSAPVKRYNVSAVLARNVLKEETLVYNSREENGGPIHDPTAILYVNTDDLITSGPDTGKLKPEVPVEPLILRANAGDCIEVTLRNRLPNSVPPDLDGFSTMPMIIKDFNANQVKPSRFVGLHPQLVSHDINRTDGIGIGFNRAGVVPPGEQRFYRWYAGDLKVQSNGIMVATPVEFGSINLMSSDLIKHSNKGAVAALIIEPLGSTWQTDFDLNQNKKSRAAANVRNADGNLLFREFVAVFQNDVNLRFGSNIEFPTHEDPEHPVPPPIFAMGDAVPNTADAEDPEDSGQKAINYRTEPMWFRMGFAPNDPLGFTRTLDFSDALTNAKVGGDPETPVFTAEDGTPIRFRVLEPGGHQRNHVFTVSGHVWQRLPYQNDSKEIGDNPLSMFEGAREGHGPTNHLDVVLQNGAGGKNRVTGDYLWRDMASFQFDGGIWGILRVE